MTLSSPKRKKMENTVISVKPSRNKPASSLGMLRVTSAVRAKATKAAAVLAPAAKASLIRVAARPVARVWPVMLIGVPLINVAHKISPVGRAPTNEGAVR